jgi:small subunit ribosomal protein S33
MASAIANASKVALTRPSQERMMALKQLQCSIFSTTFNPTSARTGAKYLKGRLRGPSMVEYYPKTMSFRDINRLYPELDLVDEDEETRILDLMARKARGKGPPPKAKKAG